MFYVFRQNNSGGSWDIDELNGIGKIVIVEADNEDSAVEEAEKIGLYFDGVKKGLDCECCGDRWDGYPDEYDTLYDISECVSITKSSPVYVHQRHMIVELN